MKRSLCLVTIALTACLLFASIAYAESAGQAGVPVNNAVLSAATEALQDWIEAGYPVNGVKGVKIARAVQPGVDPKADGPKSLSLAAMPSEMCTRNAYMTNRYTNPFSFTHPIFYTATPSNVEYAVTPTVTGLGTLAELQKVNEGGIDYYYLVGLAPGTVKLTITASNGVHTSKTIRIKQKVVMADLTLYSNMGMKKSIIEALPDSLTLAIPDPNVHEDIHPLIVSSRPTSASYGGFMLDGGMFFPAFALKAMSDNDDVVTVSSEAGPVNVLLPKKPGTARVIVKATDGGKARESVKLTIKGIGLRGVSLDAYGPDGISLLPGTKKQIQPEFFPVEAYDKTLIWTSSDKEVATVNSSGIVTGVARGSATISCRHKASGKYDSVPVKVGYGKDAAGTTYRFFGFNCSNENVGENNLDMMASVYRQACGSENVFVIDGAADVNDVYTLLESTELMGIKGNDVTVLYISAKGADYTGRSAERGALMDVNGDLITVGQIQGMLEHIPGTLVLIVDSDLSGQFIASKGASPSANAAQAKAFNKAWISAFSGSKATNFTAKALTGSAVSSKFKILTSCRPLGYAYSDAIGAGSNNMFGWFTYWLGKGLGANPNRTTGDLGAFDPASLPANINPKGGAAITLNEAYLYTRNNMANEFTPAFRQYVCVWPANDQTAIFNLVP